MERPPKKYVCEKCGYLGDTSEHEGCDYLAWTTGEQLCIDQLERELALLKASPVGAPEGYAIVPVEILDRFPEINPSNYDHDGACALNAWGVELVLSAAPVPSVSEDRKDAELLDYIQNHGATIQLVPMANRTFGFEVGGLHKSRKLSVREAIDAAMQEDKP